MAQPLASQPSAISYAVRYWWIDHIDGKCQNSTDSSLWFASLFAFAVVWSYILGANDVRGWIHNKFGAFSEPWTTEFRFCVAILGSLALQLGMTVATAKILQDSNQALEPRNRGLSYPFVAWYLRPLPATAISFANLISPRSYIQNIFSVGIVEVLYGLGSIGFYIELRRRSAAVSSTLSKETSPAATQPTAISTSVPTGVPSSIAMKTTAPASQATSVTVSEDRTCGRQTGHNCKGSRWGGCCSQWGFCGSDPEYCGEGCQTGFGVCSSSKFIRRTILSPDGTCGESSGYTCLNSTWGNCCSSSSFCGTTTDYCGSGCLPDFGVCNVERSHISSPTIQSANSSLKLMSTGSLLGLLTWVFFYVAIFALFVCPVSWWRGTRRRSLRIAAALCIVLNASRLAVGFILWNAALQLVPYVFCPDGGRVAKITVLWAFVPAIDHLWRALF